MSVHIKEISFGSPEYEAVLDIRYAVLRRPIGMELRPKDTELDDTEFHIAAFDGEAIIGCVLLRPLSATHLKLRQMAVMDSYQGKGIGAALVRFAEGFAARKNFGTIETNARRTAQGFYEKLGYKPLTGDVFMEVSLHTVTMHKILQTG